MNTALTFNRFYAGIGIGKLSCDAQGAAIGTGLDAGGLEEQWFPVGRVSQTYHLFLCCCRPLLFRLCWKAINSKGNVSVHLNCLFFHFSLIRSDFYLRSFKAPLVSTGGFHVIAHTVYPCLIFIGCISTVGHATNPQDLSNRLW